MSPDPPLEPYHEYLRPDEDDGPWADRWEAVRESVDADLKLSGPKAACPASSEAPADAWYHATDEQLVYTNGQQGWELMQRGSGRFAGNVYYDPDRPGPYSDLADAVSDVVPGATLYLAPRDFDIPSEGPIHSETPISVQGAGHGRADHGGSQSGIRANVGTRLLNNGPERLDTSVIDITGESHEGMSSGTALRDFYVASESQHHPVIAIREFPDVHIEKVWASGCDTAPQVLLLQSSWFSRVYSSLLRDGRTHGCLVRGTGYCNEFYTSNVHSSQPDGIATETRRKRTIIIGGEHVCTGENGTGISLQNPGRDQGGARYGHVIIEPGFEHTPNGIRINDEHDGEPVEHVEVYSTHFPDHSDHGTGIVFGNCRGCRVLHPKFHDPYEITFAEWSDRAVDCGIIADYAAIKGKTLVDNGAENPYLAVQGTVAAENLQNVPTEVPVSVQHVPERHSMAFRTPGQDRWHVAETTPL